VAQPGGRTIVRAFVQQGTYFSEAVSEDWDAAAPPVSQSYLAHVAVRAIILIEADDPVIGLVAFVGIGMDEVSSCMIGKNVTPGCHVAKGEEIGRFQFGVQPTAWSSGRARLPTSPSRPFPSHTIPTHHRCLSGPSWLLLTRRVGAGAGAGAEYRVTVMHLAARRCRAARWADVGLV